MKRISSLLTILWLLFSCSTEKTEKEDDGAYCTYFHKNGIKDGVSVCYYKNGVIRDSLVYKNNLIHGEKLTFDSLGNKSSIVTYHEGRKNGIFIMYYPNGNILCTGNYLNDSLSGWYYEYYPTNKLKLKSEYIYLRDRWVNNQGIFFHEDGNSHELS